MKKLVPFLLGFGLADAPVAGAASYSEVVRADQPIHYWRLGEATDAVSARDEIGNNHGQYLNVPSVGQPGALQDDPDTAVAFAGTPTAAQSVVARNPFTGSSITNFSIEFWMRTTVNGAGAATGNTYAGNGLVWSDVPGAALDWAVNILADRVSFWDHDAGTTDAARTLTSTTSVTSGQWLHIVATREAGLLRRIYLNGVENVNKAAGRAVLGARPDLHLGANFGDNRFYNGLLDEVAIYDKVLTPEQVLAHYQAWTNGVPQTAPVITQQPTGANALIGGSLALTVTAIGSQPLTYQWRKGGNPLPGATGAALVLNNLQAADAGSYDVLVSNSQGDTPSAAAVVTVSAPDLSSGLQGHWTFDDPLLIGRDSSPNTNHLTASGQAAYSPAGWSLGALELDGTSGFLTAALFPRGIPTRNSPFTIAAWIKPTSSGSRGIVGYGIYGTANSQNRQGNAFRLNGANGLASVWQGVAANTLSVADVTPLNLLDGNWHHTAMTYDGTTRRLWLNGAELTSDLPLDHFFAATNFTLGRANVTELFAGLLDELRIYNRALSAVELDELVFSVPIVNTNPPSFVIQPAGGTVWAGDPFTLAVVVDGQAPISLQWYKDGGAVPGATSRLLSFAPIQMTDGGNYTVVAQNNLGTRTSEVAVVTVNLPTIQTGLQGHWRFDNPANLGLDSSPNSNQLSAVVSAPGEASFALAGHSGGALWLNGTNAYLAATTFPTGIPTGNSHYTVSAWIKPVTGGARGIVGWGNYGSTRQCNALRLFISGSNTNWFRHYWWGDDLDVNAGNAGADLFDGNFHLVVATYDGSTRTIWVDGQVAGTKAFTQANNAQPLNFGVGKTTGTEYWHGWLDEVRIYNRALDQRLIDELVFLPPVPRLPTITRVEVVGSQLRLTVHSINPGRLHRIWGTADPASPVWTEVTGVNVSGPVNDVLVFEFLWPAAETGFYRVSVE